MTRTTLAIALATGALAVPAVALASGGAGDTAPSSTTPVQQQEQQPEQQPEQRPQQPRDQDRPGHPCPEDQGGGGSSEGSGGSSQTQL
jgi:hypothetical protein